MYFVPSLQQEVLFEKTTIGQFKDILNETQKYSFLNIGFNLSLIECLQQNCTQTYPLTNFDKEILLLQIYYKEVIEKNIPNKTVSHPISSVFKNELYEIVLNVPSLIQEKQYCLRVLHDLNKNNKDDLLLGELTKYITSIQINNTDINWNINFLDRIKILKNIPPSILAECITYIDNIKQQVKEYYSKNNCVYKFDITMLIN